MLLGIDRIKDEVQRDNNGQPIPDPYDPSKKTTVEVVKPTSINVYDIEEVRPFDKDGKKHAKFDGPISVIHKYKHIKSSSHEVHVLGDHQDIINKINKLKAGHINEQETFSGEG